MHFQKQAKLFYEMGKLKESITCYEEGLATLGKSVPLILALVEVLEEASRFEEALQWIQELKHHAGKPEEFILLEAKIFEKAGRNPDAQRAYEKVLKQAEERLDHGRVTQFSLMQKMRALYGLGRLDEAKSILPSIGPAVQRLEIYQKLEGILR